MHCECMRIAREIWAARTVAVVAMRVHDAQTGGHGWAGLTELQGVAVRLLFIGSLGTGTGGLGLYLKRREPAAPSFPRVVVEHRHGDSLASQVNGRSRELRRASKERLHARGLRVRVSRHRLGRSGRAHPRDIGGRQSHHQALNGRVRRRRAHRAVLKLVHLRGGQLRL